MMFERDLPGENTMGFNNTEIDETVPLEMCETMNGSWGFNLIDTNYKSVERLVRTMVRSAGFGGNFLLNTGPMPNGKIQPENVDTLMAIGEWMEKYGESIYGTRKGPIRPQEWGAVTTKGKTVYVHFLGDAEAEIEIPGYRPGIKSATYFEDGSEADVKRSKDGLLIKVSKEKIRPIDTIIKITLK
jgi:alpha-L-fucosidase